MKVSELIYSLSELDQESEIILQTDSEDNYYRLTGINSDCIICGDSGHYVEVIPKMSGLYKEDDDDNYSEWSSFESNSEKVIILF